MADARTTVLLVLAALAFGLAGCGDGATTATSPPATAAPPTTQSAVFPVTVQAEHGPVEIVERPDRIVSLSPSLTEMLWAIDAGDQVVAVDRYSNHPAGTPTTDLSGFRPNVEAVAGFDPDLVVLASDRDGVVASLTAVGIPTLLLSSPEHLHQVGDQLAALGAATGHPAEAAAAATALDAELAEVADAAPERLESVRYYYELSDTHHTITSSTFIGELLATVGLDNIADEAAPAAGGYPQLSAEFVLDADPDLVLLAHSADGTGTPEAVAARPGWDQLGAVARGHVVALDPDLASRWGPRLPELLRTVVHAAELVPLP